jgi:hypothetical protein
MSFSQSIKLLSLLIIITFLMPTGVIYYSDFDLGKRIHIVDDVIIQNSDTIIQQIPNQNPDWKPIMSNSVLNPSSFDLLSGDFFDTAITITMTNGTGDIAKTGSITETLVFDEDFFFWPEKFFKYDITQNGPVSISVSSPISTNDFQFYALVFTEPFGIDVASDFEGNPLELGYFASEPGEHYIVIGGWEGPFPSTFYEEPQFTITIEQLVPGASPQGTTSTLFQSAAFDQMKDIFQFFIDDGYILEGAELTPDISKINNFFSDNSTTFDPTDLGYFKGLGLAIYGITRFADMIPNTDARTLEEKHELKWTYLNLAIDIVKYTMGDSQYVYENGNERLYIDQNSDAILIDNAYILLGISEIAYQASKDLSEDPFSPITNAEQVDRAIEVYNWGSLIAEGIFQNFESATAGGFVHKITDVGGFNTSSDFVYLESLAVLYEVFQWWQFAGGELDFLESNVDDNNLNIVFPVSVFDFNSKIDDIDNFIVNNLILTDNSNATNYFDVDPSSNLGIGMEYYNLDTLQISNTSTLASNIAYLQYKANLEMDISVVSDFGDNILALFNYQNTGLLLSKILIIDDGSKLPEKISTLENAMMIFLAQRIDKKWIDIFQDSVGRTWKQKSLEMLSSLNNLLYDSLTKSYFGGYNLLTQKIEVNENDINLNKFVANSFMLTPLTRLFPVQMGTVVEDRVIVGTTGSISLELSQVFLTDATNWFDWFSSFQFQATVVISEFGFESTVTVDMNDFFDFSFDGVGESQILNFNYVPTMRGSYTIEILLGVEGVTLLSQSIELVSYGVLRADATASNPTFKTDDSSFTAVFTLIDDRGDAIPNLTVNTSLIRPFEEQADITFIKTGRSDSSGRVSVRFTTTTINTLLNVENIIAQPVVPDSISINLFINVTNADSRSLVPIETILRIPVTLELAKYYIPLSINNLEFATSDRGFEAEITIIDAKGNAVPNLQVEGSLGLPRVNSSELFGSKYIVSGLTDASGKVIFEFDVSEFEGDFVNRSALSNQAIARGYIFSNLYIKTTDSDDVNFAGDMVIRAKINLASISARTSPTSLVMVQGTTDAFSFIVSTLDENANPITNATVTYSIQGLPNSQNQVFTNTDGEATITFRDNILFGLSNLAIVARMDDPTNFSETITTIFLTIEHIDYPTRQISREITILPNNIKISANPVQSVMKAKNLFEEIKPKIDIEVATEDLFSRVIPAEVHIEWADPEWNRHLVLNPESKHLSPYTFALDPTDLPSGEYELLIIARKDGITTTAILEVETDGLELDQLQIIDIPAITARRIIVEPVTLADIGYAFIGVITGFAVAFLIGLGKDYLKESVFYKNCPYCKSHIKKSIYVCSSCGRDLPSKGDKSIKTDGEAKNLSDSSKSDSTQPKALDLKDTQE